MTDISSTTRKNDIHLTKDKEITLPLDDVHGWPTLISGNTPDYQVRVAMTVTGLPAGEKIQVRCLQGDYQQHKGQPSTWKEIVHGGVDLQKFKSDGDVIQEVFYFDGSVSNEPKGYSRRVRLAAVATADCTITGISTRTRKE